ncbi:IPT/TIG domain-containing protein, partial [Flavobacterium sp. RSB2_4_14]|uniref:IPT/TIG domain-containing protein n=1 Tax=Flavobacterium sp. RSB2_4_14 TaxID=3447665 RepID=UPI003F3B88EA
MNLNLLSNSSTCKTSCCHSDNNVVGWKNNINKVMLFVMLVLGYVSSYSQAPSISSFSPTSAAQGQLVTITGTNFTGVTSVKFGLIEATSFTIVNPTTITATVATGNTGSVRVTKPGFLSANLTGFTFIPAPSCNLVGPLKACLSDGNILITATIQFSGASPGLTFSFPAGPQNTTGASLISTTPFVFNPITNSGTTTALIHPGTNGGQINFQLIVSALGGSCECSKSITIIDLELTNEFEPILCYGGTTTLHSDASSSGSSSYTFTLNPGNIVVGPQSDPTTEFPGLTAGNYTMTVVDDNGCSKVANFTITEPPLNPVVLRCPESKTELSCQSQADVNIAFNSWLNSFGFSGGTNPILTRNPLTPNAPSACGGSVDVTWTVTDDCGQPQTCTRTFTVTSDTIPPVITATGTTLSLGCNPTTAAINAALGTASATDNCTVVNPTSTEGQLVSDGCFRSLTRTWNVSDGCGNPALAVSRTVTWTASIAVAVTGPSNVAKTSCD